MLHIIGFRVEHNVSFMKNQENELRKGEVSTRERKITGKRVMLVAGDGDEGGRRYP